MNADREGRPTGASTRWQARGRLRTRALQVAMTVVAAVLLLVAMPGVSQATVTVSRAEVSGDRLRIEGTAAPNRTITVDGVAMGSSDGAGQFRIERSGFSAPADCTVDVNDGSAAATSARLSGCTVSSPPAAPSLSALTLSQSDVVGGTLVPGTVSLTSAAPTGGVVVTLSSDNTTAATVPPSVTVPAGATSAGFTVTTHPVQNSQSAIIIGTAGGATRHAVLTVRTEFDANNGSISLARGCVGPCGGGTVTSQPAGVNCTITPTSTSGACGNVFFPAGTQVRLEVRPDANSKFQGWDFEVSCRDAPNVTVQAGVAHICRPVLSRR